jgi:CheY-like chemotaxis protein
MSEPERMCPHVLLVDDNESVLEFITEVLTGWGPFAGDPCEVTIASSVAEATERLGSERFDLVILDMVLHDGNGLELLNHVRNLDPPPHSIILSADDPEDLRRRAREMGASIFLRKGDGVESLVRATLSLLHARGEEKEGAGMDGGPGREEGPGRILVVDDDPLVSDALASMMELIEWVEVRTAGGGRQGLEIARAWHPHVILLDIAMPDMDGRKTLEAIIAAGMKSRVVMVSAFRDADIARECVESGAVDYIPKPVDFQFLKRAISGHLALARQEEEGSG